MALAARWKYSCELPEAGRVRPPPDGAADDDEAAPEADDDEEAAPLLSLVAMAGTSELADAAAESLLTVGDGLAAMTDGCGGVNAPASSDDRSVGVAAAPGDEEDGAAIDADSLPTLRCRSDSMAARFSCACESNDEFSMDRVATSSSNLLLFMRSSICLSRSVDSSVRCACNSECCVAVRCCSRASASRNFPSSAEFAPDDELACW